MSEWSIGREKRACVQLALATRAFPDHCEVAGGDHQLVVRRGENDRATGTFRLRAAAITPQFH